MNLPKPKKINAERYVAGLSSFKQKTAKIKLSANESALGPSPKAIKEFYKVIEMPRKLHIKPNRSLTHLQILFFLFITGFLIIFIGGRFLLVGAWPIIIFGIVEFSILVVCTYFFVKSLKKTEKISLESKSMQLERLDGDEVIEQNSYNLNWLKIKNEKNSLSINYAGKKKFFASFLSEDRRKKLKRIIEKYSSSSS